MCACSTTYLNCTRCQQCSPRGLSSGALSGVGGVWIVSLPSFFSSLLPPTSPHHPPSLPAAAVRPTPASVHPSDALQMEFGLVTRRARARAPTLNVQLEYSDLVRNAVTQLRGCSSCIVLCITSLICYIVLHNYITHAM